LSSIFFSRVSCRLPFCFLTISIFSFVFSVFLKHKKRATSSTRDAPGRTCQNFFFFFLSAKASPHCFSSPPQKVCNCACLNLIDYMVRPCRGEIGRTWLGTGHFAPGFPFLGFEKSFLSVSLSLCLRPPKDLFAHF